MITMQHMRKLFHKLSSNVRVVSATKKIKKATTIAFSNKYLLFTNITISASLSTIGDVLEQRYEMYTKEIEKWNKKRTAHMAFSGLTVGFVCHHWYKMLDRFFVGRNIKTVCKKLLLDQFISSPINILLFFASVSIFEDHPWNDFTQEVNDKFWRLYAAEWVVWPPAQVFNFYYLPTKYRVLYDNTISLGYDVFTSNVKHSKPQKLESKPEGVDRGPSIH